MFKNNKFLLLCIVLHGLLKKGEGLHCLHCESISHPQYCQVVTQCNTGEECYTRTVESVDGFKSYRVGCTTESSLRICNVSIPNSDRSQCLECCNSTLCNAGLCGQKGYPTSRGPVCYSCQSRVVGEPCSVVQYCAIDHRCYNTATCAIDEVCSISYTKIFSEILYTSGCSQKHMCEAHINHGGNPAHIIGRRDVNGRSDEQADDLAPGHCHLCCDKDLCNANCTQPVTKYCNSSPCHNGASCMEMTGGFKCVCPPRFTGTLCDQDINECMSMPCYNNATCHDEVGGYRCVCLKGFVGLRCRLVDRCASSPCHNGGTCHVNESDFSCTCPHGYSGVTCSVGAGPVHDCYDVLRNGVGTTDGVYTITTPLTNRSLDVYCDMTTDGGGWTVFQYRVNGSVDFYRTFAEYEHGFGKVHGEFWLGLRDTYEIAAQCPDNTSLRIDMENSLGKAVYITFHNFSLAPAPKYTLYLNAGNGTTGDNMNYLVGHDFSTFDHDTDRKCARIHHNGWWNNHCTNANLNGIYTHPPGSYGKDSDQVMYYFYLDAFKSLKMSRMQIRRSGTC